MKPGSGRKAPSKPSGRRSARGPDGARQPARFRSHLRPMCPARGIGAAIIMPAVNTEAMNEHLKEISCQVATSAHALLVCDGAGWHQPGKRLIVPDNILCCACRPRTRTQPDGKRLGLSARQQVKQPGL